jgi:DNA-binding CsgD family transcriptional regulator
MIAKLTPREKEVLQHLSKAEDRKTVASDLGISIYTVAAHIRNLHLKTNTRSLSELALIGKDQLPGESDNLNTVIPETGLSLKFKVSPNPTKDFININSAIEIDEVQLFDTRGKLLFMKEYKKADQEQITINLSSMKSGVYYLHVITYEGIATKKIIKL